MNIKVVGIVLERDGEQKVVMPVADETVRAAKSELERQGLSADSCNCGDEACVGGYVWRCAPGPDDDCQWYASDWRCND